MTGAAQHPPDEQVALQVLLPWWQLWKAMPAPVDGGILVSTLHGVKEKAFVPRNYSMAMFSLNSSHVFIFFVICLYF